MRIWAILTEQGTAMSETSLCDEHLTPSNRVEAIRDADLDMGLVWLQDDPFVDCSGNEALECRVCGRKGERVVTTVEIPGTVFASYEDGKILDITFTPHASSAGYSGPTAVLWEGDGALDVESVDGPFWRAMQTYLADFVDEQSIEWTE